MKSRRFVSLSILSILSLGLLTGIVTHHATQTSSEVLTTEATAHPANFAEYTYSGHYYDSITATGEGMSGTLRKALTDKINPDSVPTYGSSGQTHLSTQLQYADEDPTNSSNMIYLYTRDSVTKNAANTWNREHVWPQSLSNGHWGRGRAGSDMLHIRPTYDSTNGKRGNDKYGEVASTSPLKYNGMDYGYSDGTYFMPLASVKGDVARICMYVWVSYFDEYGNTHPALTNVFQSFDTLMNWHIHDKPDVMEGNRNDYVEKNIQFNRNPFVDHPEYAWKIFGSQCSASVLAEAKAIYPDPSQDPVAVTGVSLNKTNASLEVSDTLQLTATVTPSNATNKAVTWKSNNTTVASVSNTGLITAKAAGSAAITVTTADGGFTATCNVTVTAPVPVLTSITLSGNYQKSFRVNDTFNHDGLVVTANYSVGGSHVVNDYVISEPNMSTAGTKTVTVSYTDGVTKTASYQITVDNLVSITLSGGKREFVINEAFSYAGLVVTANYAVAASRTVTPTSVSTPDTSSLGEKEVTVSYTENGITQSASYFIDVVSEPSPVIPVESITLNFERKEILVGQSFELVVTFNPENATNKELRWEIDYFDDPDYEGCIAIQDGWITGLKVGYAGIMITSLDNPKASAFCMVKIVKDKPSPKKSGCFGSVEATSIILSSLSILGIGLLLIKRKTSDK